MLYTKITGPSTWYSNVPTPTRVEYQDSPIQWHSNPMYANLEDLEARSMDGYGAGGIQPLWKADSSGLNPVQIQPRSTSRTSIYSTTSSSDQEGTASSSVMLSTLEPVARQSRQQQS